MAGTRDCLEYRLPGTTAPPRAVQDGATRRCPDERHCETLKGSTVPIGFGDLRTALTTGLVDVQENSLSVFRFVPFLSPTTRSVVAVSG